MSTPTELLVLNKLEQGSKDFRGMKLPFADFKGKDLRGVDFRSASLVQADFTDANLKCANFEGANCYAAKFTRADLHRVNFKDACLANAQMDAKDLYGVTVTLQCNSFEGLKLSPGWWYGWLFYGYLMDPPSEQAKNDLLALLGPQHFEVLRSQYTRRRI